MDILGIEPDPNFPVATLEHEGVRYDIVLPHAARDHIQQFVMRSGQPYELGMMQDMRQRLGRGDLFLDIGANIGNHTLYLASVAGVRVTAFEPNADLCAAMAESIIRNRLENLVSVQAVALGRAAGRVRSAKATPENLGGQSLTPGAGEIAALDDLDLAGPVRAIKINVEGMEADVLYGGSALIARDRPAIYIECQDEATFRQVTIWAQTAGYTHWETFNATATHLFRPSEAVSLEQRLERLNAREMIQEYRMAAQEEKRLPERAEARDARVALEAERALLAERVAAQRVAAAKISTVQTDLERAQAELAWAQAEVNRLRRYGRALEAKHAAVLNSKTWRAMSPVRWALRSLKRRPPPQPFVAKLTAESDIAKTWHGIESRQQESGRPGLIRFNAAAPRSERVTVFLATFPARRANLEAVVASLLPQCHILRVYLNEYDHIPDCLKAENIRVTLGRDAAGDIKDNGKFFSVADHPEGYHVFADDDLCYPPDYVARIVAGIRSFGFRAIVGLHGTIYQEPLGSYIHDRSVLPYYRESRHVFVDQLGTGTAGYHTTTFTPPFSVFETAGTCDLWFARAAAERGVPLVALARPDQWLTSMGEVGDSLFLQAKRDDSLQTELLRNHLAPVLRRMRVRQKALETLRALYTPAHLERNGLNVERSLSGAFGAPKEQAKRDIHFAIIVTGWNCAAFVQPCLSSLEAQIPGHYTFDVHVYDDDSNDNTWDILRENAEVLNLRITRGEKNMGPAFARETLIRQIAEGSDICVLLDMDDELLPHALQNLEKIYRANSDCWMTYGNWVNQNGRINDEGIYSDAEIDTRAYRTLDVFRFTHLRSFRRFLYDRVDKAHLKDAEGEWLRYCSDVGLMLPIADQCTSRNVIAVEEPLYRYNQYRPTGTQKRFGSKKRETAEYLRKNPALFRHAPATPR